jgi:hypothetical protein
MSDPAGRPRCAHPRTPPRAGGRAHPRTAAAAAVALVTALGLIACGGGERPAAEAPEAGSSDSVPAGSTADRPAAAPVDREPAAPIDSGHAGVDTPAPVRSDSTAAPGDADGWSTGSWTADRGGEPGRLVGVKVGRHDDYDRLVLVFSDRVPGYTVRYPEEPLHQCGSGRPIDVGAPRVLHIDLEPASAHNQRGHSTLAERSLSPGLAVLRSSRLICDYEGHVEWALGLEREAPLRVFALEGPARLVVDVRH